jgi:hypothetical protein
VFRPEMSASHCGGRPVAFPKTAARAGSVYAALLRTGGMGVMKMKMMMAATGLMSLALAALATPAAATTIDFSGAGTVDYDTVSQNYGDSAEADLSYRTLSGGNNWGQTATQSDDHVYYWADPSYSHDQAIFATANGNKLELGLQAGGAAFTSVSFHLGSFPNFTQSVAFKLYDAAWNVLLSSDTLLIDGNTGALVSLAVNTTALYFQMGDNWNTGIQSVSYQTVGVATTPVPAALPLFATALAVMGVAARRRRRGEAHKTA